MNPSNSKEVLRQTVDKAIVRIGEFLSDTGLPWNTFENAFDTLQRVVSNDNESRLTGSSPLIRVTQDIWDLYQKGRNQYKLSWAQFYEKLFDTLDNSELNLPEGFQWEKTSKTEWRIVRIGRSGHALGNLLDKTSLAKSGFHVLEPNHILLRPREVCTPLAYEVPRRLRISGEVKKASSRAYVLDLAFRVPIRRRSQIKDHIEKAYLDRKKVESIVYKMIRQGGNSPNLTQTISRAAESVNTDKLCHTERLNTVIHV